MRLLGRLDAAKRDQRLPSRLGRRHAGAQVVVDVQLQVAGELVGELALGMGTAKERRYANRPGAKVLQHDASAPVPAVAAISGRPG